VGEVRAKDVTVEKVFRARCHLPGCGWTGPDRAAFAEAGDDRSGHLTWHRMTQDMAPHATGGAER